MVENWRWLLSSQHRETIIGGQSGGENDTLQRRERQKKTRISTREEKTCKSLIPVMFPVQDVNWFYWNYFREILSVIDFLLPVYSAVFSHA